jgi:hypothetical protein
MRICSWRRAVLVAALLANCTESNSNLSQIALEPVNLVHISPRSAGDIGSSTQALLDGTTAGGLTTSKAGATATFAMVLDTAPTASVNVTVVSSNTSAGLITTPASHVLTFTTANWSTPQNAIISGVSDFIADGTQNYTVGYTAASGDTNYNGLAATLFNVSNLDDNVAQILVTSNGLTTDTSGTTGTFTVALTSQPLASVTVAISTTDIYSATVSPATLTFTTGNWSTPQTVTLTGQVNYVQGPANGGTPYYVQVGPAVSSDASYTALPPQILAATHRDTMLNQLVIIAGQPGGSGNVDGPRTLAHFAGADGVAIDATGNFYVSDDGNRTVRKITPAGIVTTVAGQDGVRGTADGVGTSATFQAPGGISIDATGNIYIADWYEASVRKMTPDGAVTTFVPSGIIDGIQNLSVDATGNLYVPAIFGDLIYEVTPAGAVSLIAGGAQGSADGVGTAAQFSAPWDIAFDTTGTMYIAEYTNDDVRKMTPGRVVTTLAHTPMDPVCLKVDAAGNVFVGGGNQVVKITPAGVVSPFAGGLSTGAVDGTGTGASFWEPSALVFDPTGTLYVADDPNENIRAITTGAVTSTFAGSVSHYGTANGLRTAAEFWNPQGVAVDATGNVYVADHVGVRKVTPAGLVTTIQNSASLSSAPGIALDAAGNVYASQGGAIIKVAAGGGSSTFAGNVSTYGTTDGVGAAARFNGPTALTIDAAGTLYVVDYYSYTLRKITSAGVVTTWAGTVGTAGTTDAVGTAAQFKSPSGIAVDATGNVYVTDASTFTLRKISPSANVTTFAGATGTRGTADGVGAAARFGPLLAAVTDSSGDIFVADGNSTIRKVTPAGVVTTVLGLPGVVGVMPGNLPASINSVQGLALFGNALIMTDYIDMVVMRAAQAGGW